MIVWGYFLPNATQFWIAGALVGTVLGGTQAISRSLMGKFTPERLTGELFGFYAIGGKFAAVLGPFAFSTVAAVTGNVRFGVLSLGAFLLLGLAMLFTVKEQKGIEDAQAVEKG